MPKPQKQKENVTFRIDTDKKQALDELAESMQRDRSFLLNEAVTVYLDVHRWHMEDIERGIQEADAGLFVPDETVKAYFSKWINHAG